MRKLLARMGFYRPRPGDVVLDRYDGKAKTVEAFDGRKVAVVHFDGPTLRRGGIMLGNLPFIR